MAWSCLNPNLAKEFLNKLKSGEVDPNKLSEMSSKERHSFFAGFLGQENAAPVNALFESKLLLKDQQQGIITWAEQVAGMKPEVKRDIISRVQRMDKVLTPETEAAFLADLAEKKLGMSVTMAEASHIAELAKGVSEAKAKVAPDSKDFGPERMKHGEAVVKFKNYMTELKADANSAAYFESLKNPLNIASEVGGIAKSMNTTLDNSAIFRQGWKAMMTNPVIWAGNAINTFANIARTFGGKNVMDISNARIVSSRNYDLAVKAKLAVATIEEDLPTSLPEKIPLFGRVYTAAEHAFTAFVHGLRMDIFSKHIDKFREAGVDVNDPVFLSGLGKVVNSLTGRGDLGVFEPAGKYINNFVFSSRAVKGQVDVWTGHLFDPKMSAQMKGLAAKNLLKIIAATATLKVLAEQLQPGSTEQDPRSSDSGKIKTEANLLAVAIADGLGVSTNTYGGKTRFDITGGAGSVITLASRLASGYTKTATGRLKKIDPMEAVGRFIENKASPITAAAIALSRGKDRDKKPVNVTSAEGALNLLDILFTPMPIKSIRDNADKLQ